MRRSCERVDPEPDLAQGEHDEGPPGEQQHSRHDFSGLPVVCRQGQTGDQDASYDARPGYPSAEKNCVIHGLSSFAPPSPLVRILFAARPRFYARPPIFPPTPTAELISTIFGIPHTERCFSVDGLCGIPYITVVDDEDTKTKGTSDV